MLSQTSFNPSIDKIFPNCNRIYLTGRITLLLEIGVYLIAELLAAEDTIVRVMGKVDMRKPVEDIGCPWFGLVGRNLSGSQMNDQKQWERKGTGAKNREACI